MTILTLSDTHGQHRKLDLNLEDIDTVEYAGDWTKHHDTNFSETLEFLAWFNSLNAQYKILIAGNHEVLVENKNEEFYEILTKFPSIIYLQDSGISILGINFYGSPCSNEFYNWAFMHEEPELKEIWNKIPDDTHVLITHGPAYRACDKVEHSPELRDLHVGSKSLAARKLELPNLKVHVSGHIHEAYGVEIQNKVKNVCPCIFNGRYKPINESIKVEVTLQRKTTQYLYGCNPSEFENLPHADALKYKLKKAGALVKELFEIPYMYRDIQRITDSTAAQKHTEMLIDEFHKSQLEEQYGNRTKNTK